MPFHTRAGGGRSRAGRPRSLAGLAGGRGSFAPTGQAIVADVALPAMTLAPNRRPTRSDRSHRAILYQRAWMRLQGKARGWKPTW